jgi:hypothetical protein
MAAQDEQKQGVGQLQAQDGQNISSSAAAAMSRRSSNRTVSAKQSGDLDQVGRTKSVSFSSPENILKMTASTEKKDGRRDVRTLPSESFLSFNGHQDRT